MSESDSYFPKIMVLLVYLALRLIVLAWCALWSFGSDQVWYMAWGRIFLWKHLPSHDFEIS